jgi:predicted flap endonuclease-1-like 5' DNA nuclease
MHTSPSRKERAMAAYPEFNFENAAANAEKALCTPLGFASPLWWTYSAMAGAGVAYWWMNQLMKPINLEAMTEMMGKYPLAPVPERWFGEAPAVAAEMATASMAKAEQRVADILEAAVPEPGPLAAALEPEVEAVEAMAYTAPKIVEATADDLTKLSGIGPTLASKLSDLGVRTFADIASWTQDDLDHYDKQLKLLGRAARDKWVDQAKQFKEAGDATAH